MSQPDVLRNLAFLMLLVAGRQACSAEVEAPRVLDERLTLELIAAEPDIVTPTGIAVDQRGRVLVIESHTHFRPEGYQGPQADRIRSFEDRDGDGKYETIGTFFEGTAATMSLAEYHDGSFYVATRSEVFRLRDTDDDGQADERTQIVKLDTPGNYPHNGLSGFAFDFRGEVVFGFGENLGAEYKLIGSDGTTLVGGGEGGNIYCCAPDGSKLRQIATGFWNPFHLCFDAFGRLFAVDNDPDSRPPCRLLHVVEGGDYGYRFRNGRKGLHPFTAWNGELPGTLPMVAGTGEAPSGMLAYESDNLPQEYLGNLLVTSWGDHRIERYRLKPRGASFVSTMEPVVIGGENFRPVGIALAPDGSLFISDWVDKSYKLHGKGRIWRLRAKQPGKQNRPTDPREALTSLHRPLREHAARQLAADAAGRQHVCRQLETGEDQVRAAAMSALAAADEMAVDLGQIMTSDQPLRVRALAARLATPATARRTLSLVMAFKQSESPEILAELLMRAEPSGPDDRLIATLGALSSRHKHDPFIRHGGFVALRKQASRAEHLFEESTLHRATWEAGHRLMAALVAKESGSMTAQKAIPKLLSDADPEVRFVAVQWIAEERLTEYREQLFEGLKSPNMPKRLFDAYLAALVMLDGEEAKKFDQDGGEAYVARLIEDGNTPPQVQARALTILRPDHPSLTLKCTMAFLKSDDAALKLAAIRTMREGSAEARQAMLEAVLGQPDQFNEALECEAIMALSPEEPRQRAMLLKYAASESTAIRQEALRTLRGAKLSPGERAPLAESIQRNSPSAQYAEELLALLEPQRLTPITDHSPADIDQWMTRLEGTADPIVGERIFHARAVGCARCHQVEGRGGRVGPDLTTTAQVLDRRRLIESILAPNKEIAPLFVPWTIQTTDGRVLVGLLIGEALDGQQTYADAQGMPFTLKPEEIELREPHGQSLMPAGLERTLTLQEFRDLLAFLQSRK